MIERILVVCEGNICRSPMAQSLLAKELPDLRVISAGWAALVGRGADPLAVELMSQRGIDIRGHIAMNLNLNHLRMADLVLAMTRAQCKTIETKYPFTRGRVYRIGEYEGVEVADPYRRGREAFEISLAQIDQCLAGWVDALKKITH